MRPSSDEYNPYYSTYIDRVKEENVNAALQVSWEEATFFLNSIPAEKANFRYAPEKWTVKELLQHIIDTERIMAYRALCFSRLESTELPGYNDDAYIKSIDLTNISLEDIKEELLLVRKASMALFKNMDNGMLDRKGVANKSTVSVRALAFIIAGHQKHHFGVLNERYFKFK